MKNTLYLQNETVPGTLRYTFLSQIWTVHTSHTEKILIFLEEVFYYLYSTQNYVLRAECSILCVFTILRYLLKV
jgi:hypothetical protein